jgi:hypothetical protein
VRRSPGVTPTSTGRAAGAAGYAFGLHLTTRLDLEVVAARRNGHRADRRTAIEVVGRDVLAAGWSRRGAELLVERRYPSGRLVMSIHRHPTLGYRVAAPRHGVHLVSLDGLTVRSALPDAPPWRWQRLLFAQVLPLAAALQGYAVVHASAVEIDGRVFAFIAASGRGKTSTAAHLVSRGATYVTDDVLALEPAAGRVFAHPGAALAAVYPFELRSMDASGRARVGMPLGRAVKQYLAIDPIDEPLPLGGVYFLERGRSAELEIVPDDPPDPQPWLASSFIWYLGTREHLAAHLDLSARIAESVPAFHLRVPDTVSAGAVAAAVERHVRERS